MFWHSVAAVVGSLAAYGTALNGSFVGDDFAYVGRFFTFPLADWPRLFIREWSEGMWGFPLPELRPMTALTFMLDARVWGLSAVGFRLTNLALHAISAVIVGSIATRVAGAFAAAWPRLFSSLCILCMSNR